ncbi:40S ribosomal protein S8 [Sciurus carolinensis]|uniref:40S ribosomal protein S8 n=1 Tax=Sciurus carolinensis TaxID=30640 RepID=A0AA41T6E5_SCICA|nr:40S ribosomal protein S8 [Sciurus carolinensis]
MQFVRGYWSQFQNSERSSTNSFLIESQKTVIVFHSVVSFYSMRLQSVVVFRVPLPLPLGHWKGAKLTPEEKEILNKKGSKKIQKKYDERKKNAKISTLLEEQFQQGELLACIASRPDRCGGADGCVLEGKELEFSLKKIQAPKGK